MHLMESSSATSMSTSPEKRHNNIMHVICHSLRGRPQKEPSREELLPADISIVDSSERTMKLRSSIPQTEYMTIEQLTNEKKLTLRNSIRRSTRACAAACVPQESRCLCHGQPLRPLNF
ncbi:GL14758 [Drosophila persimilis]|uniref:GL14758 n=1 Tax=Drosophila persimilis TaxID=7234 RepID=B4GW16_DROPE|nr:GL14758 [Drosophila persimilis]